MGRKLLTPKWKTVYFSGGTWWTMHILRYTIDHRKSLWIKLKEWFDSSAPLWKIKLPVEIDSHACKKCNECGFLCIKSGQILQFSRPAYASIFWLIRPAIKMEPFMLKWTFVANFKNTKSILIDTKKKIQHMNCP